MENKTQFYVSLDGLDLDEKQIYRIEKGIQELVLGEVSKIKSVPKDSFLITKFPEIPGFGGIRTLGMWWPEKDFILRINDFKK